MGQPIEWMVVKDNWNKQIGVIGWIGDEPALIVPFYDVADDNMDGTVSRTEWVMWKANPFSTSTSALHLVENAYHTWLTSAWANQTNGNASAQRRKNLGQLRQEVWLETGGSFIREAIWKCAMAPGAGSLGGAIGKRLTRNALGRMAIKKGTTKLIKSAFDEMFEAY